MPQLLKASQADWFPPVLPWPQQWAPVTTPPDLGSPPHGWLRGGHTTLSILKGTGCLYGVTKQVTPKRLLRTDHSIAQGFGLVIGGAAPFPCGCDCRCQQELGGPWGRGESQGVSTGFTGSSVPEKPPSGEVSRNPQPIHLGRCASVPPPAGFLSVHEACLSLSTSVTPSLTVSQLSEPVPPNLTLFHKPPPLCLGHMCWCGLTSFRADSRG